MTPEEKEEFTKDILDKVSRLLDEFVNKAVEKSLLMLPETVGNMMTNHAAMNKINAEFYSKYPEFRDKKETVAAVIEMIEGQHPLESLERIQELAVPEIRNRIKTIEVLDIDTMPTTVNRDFSHGEL